MDERTNPCNIFFEQTAIGFLSKSQDRSLGSIEVDMPQFFFHLSSALGIDPDESGLVLTDLDAAYLEACAAIPSMAAELAYKGLNPMPYGFVIADSSGETLMEVPFAERLRGGTRVHPRQCERARRLAREISDAISAARETAQRSQEIVARARLVIGR